MKNRNILVALLTAVLMIFANNAAFAWGSEKADDATILSKVQEKIKSIPAISNLIDSGQIQVNSENGKVTVTGTIPSKAEMHTLKNAIKSISGVKHVDLQNLKVQPSASTQGNAPGTQGTQSPQPSTSQ